jgi:hypothetical protein
MTIVIAPRTGRISPTARLAYVNADATSTAPGPRKLLLSRREAAAALGVSLSHFQRHIQPYLRCVYCGQLRLYRPDDLEGWTKDHAVLPAGER